MQHATRQPIPEKAHDHTVFHTKNNRCCSCMNCSHLLDLHIIHLCRDTFKNGAHCLNFCSRSSLLTYSSFGCYCKVVHLWGFGIYLRFCLLSVGKEVWNLKWYCSRLSYPLKGMDREGLLVCRIWTDNLLICYKVYHWISRLCPHVR